MKIYELFESYSLAKQDFETQGTLSTIVDNYLRLFRRLNQQNKLSGQENDINHWRKGSFDQFQQFVDSKIYAPTKRQTKRKLAPGDQTRIHEDDTWRVVVANDATAACNLGRGTALCTSIVGKPDQFDKLQAQNKTLIHVLNKHNRDMRHQYAIVYSPTDLEILDGTDEWVSKEQFEETTGLNLQSIIQKIK